MHFAVARKALLHGVADRRIVHRQRSECLAQRDIVALVEPTQAFEIARRAHVHRIGQCRHAGLGRVIVAGKIIRQHVIGIGRQRDAAQRHTERTRQDRRQPVAQIAGRHHQIQRRARTGMVLQSGMRVVAHLRQQAPQADAVGRTQRHLRLQRGIAQGLLDHRLAVVERAGHAQGLDVVAEAAQLMRLARRHPAIRIQHHHTQARLAMECRGHGSAGIAGGGDQNGERAVFGATQAGQAGGKKARTEILERGGRPMEQLQRVIAGRSQRHQWCLEVERFGADGR